ncbi:GNAT family N-acetyltransferase [Pontibacter mangrovi]|uniref:GNAT family N-acetyltransferase n=1 Tax=Pontibacter mangrovi TaxID=2589816 RepID=A0A501WCX3_9BACT|nr:GNAT family N-acetyltransferase [Pontibacter mangrovi]TPE44707.1 GNAT family N-acetyltransferase [Pontibacter mangrovi]
MPNFRFSFLSAKDLPQVRETFLKAFADYVVPVQLTEEQLRDKVEREGIVAEFCVAAFVGDEMVGFILTALGEWQGKPTAYNAGTGVVPQHRGHGLTQKMYAFLLPKLRASSVELALLEVIHNNLPALHSYERLGFRVTRTLNCYRAINEDILLPAEAPAGIAIAPLAQAEVEKYTIFRDVRPSWQNATAALLRAQEQCHTFAARNQGQEVIGYVSVFTKNGAVAQLAVAENWRGKGVGSALLRKAIAHTTAPALMFLNIEDTAQSMISFLQRRHFRLLLKQYEMQRAVVA